jgi:rod shape-determining protein MreC
MGGFLPPAERRSGALLGLYAALSLLLLAVGERIPATALRGIGAWVFAPVDRVVLSADRAAGAWRENQRLHQRITELELENARLRITGVENTRLRRQLDLPQWNDLPLKPVEILALSGEPTPVAAVVSAGRRQGVELGDALLTEEGLLGRIIEVYPTMSRAGLITDPRSSIACEVESSGVLAVLKAENVPRPRLRLAGVPVNDTVAIGERVVTSELSRLYPRGIPVGVITRMRRSEDGLTHDLEIRPSARFSRLRHGFLLPRPRTMAAAP